MPKMRVFDGFENLVTEAPLNYGPLLEISRKIAEFEVSREQKEHLHDLPSPSQALDYAGTGKFNAKSSIPCEIICIMNKLRKDPM
jgi:hypothetical protein